MSIDLEISRLLLQAGTLLVTVIAVILTIRQLYLLRLTYRDLHDWNRRKAAYDAIDMLDRLPADTALLNDKFRMLDTQDAVPLELIRKECEADANVRASLHRRLNFQETIATGVNAGVLDEEVIKTAFQRIFRTALFQFRAYIDHRRHTGAPNAWRELELVSTRWEEAASKHKPRVPTGVAK